MDDKKKMVIVGVLVLVILAVGAFQLVGMGSSPAPKSAVATKDAKKDDEVQKPAEPSPVDVLVASLPKLPARDPFAVPSGAPKVEDATLPSGRLVEPPNQKIRPLPRASGMRREIDGTSIPPFPVTGVPELPGAGNATPTLSDRTESEQAPAEAPFAYTLSGAIIGRQPAAVFRDAQGAQRLVRLGGALDGDTDVVSVEPGKVVVSHRGRRIELRVGDGSNGN